MELYIDQHKKPSSTLLRERYKF